MSTQPLSLFLVQHDDGDMYVLATGWQQAVDRWHQDATDINPDHVCSEEQPSGVQLVVRGNELLLPRELPS